MLHSNRHRPKMSLSLPISINGKSNYNYTKIQKYQNYYNMFLFCFISKGCKVGVITNTCIIIKWFKRFWNVTIGIDNARDSACDVGSRNIGLSMHVIYGIEAQRNLSTFRNIGRIFTRHRILFA